MNLSLLRFLLLLIKILHRIETCFFIHIYGCCHSYSMVESFRHTKAISSRISSSKKNNHKLEEFCIITSWLFFLTCLNKSLILNLFSRVLHVYNHLLYLSEKCFEYRNFKSCRFRYFCFKYASTLHKDTSYTWWQQEKYNKSHPTICPKITQEPCYLSIFVNVLQQIALNLHLPTPNFTTINILTNRSLSIHFSITTNPKSASFLS